MTEIQNPKKDDHEDRIFEFRNSNFGFAPSKPDTPF